MTWMAVLTFCAVPLLAKNPLGNFSQDALLLQYQLTKVHAFKCTKISDYKHTNLPEKFQNNAY